ncbi:MAG: alpha/beta hydrolase [Deltaproteobacteria bacterium]|nr:MAG: alpha/beta hydrolase [Deltaproteobacteria bacterium]
MAETIKNPTIFIHGQESSSKGTKGLFFRDLAPQMIIPDFVGDLSNRMSRLYEILRGKNALTIIGSSLGGLMAGLYSFQNPDKVKKLILLAPALNLPEFEPYLSETLTVPVSVFHGKNDEVISCQAVKVIAERVFPDLSFTVLDDDHSLTTTFAKIDWPQLLFD